jgi:hypothetical protein
MSCLQQRLFHAVTMSAFFLQNHGIRIFVPGFGTPASVMLPGNVLRCSLVFLGQAFGNNEVDHESIDRWSYRAGVGARGINRSACASGFCR